MTKKDETLFLKSCFIEKTNQYDAIKDASLWKNLKIGIKCHFKKNEKDIVVFLKVEDNKNQIDQEDIEKLKDGRYDIGVLSKEDADSIIKYVEAGLENSIYDCYICNVDKDSDENKRFSISIFIKKN